MSEVEQAELIPAEPLVWFESELGLDELPDSSVLAGGEPERALIDSIRIYGLMDPISVVERRYSGERTIVAGRRRLKAFRYLAKLTGEVRFQSIPAMVAYVDGDLSGQLTLTSNATRRDNPAADLAAIKSIRQARPGITDEEMAKVTGMPLQTIRKRLKLTGLINPLAAAFEDGDISVGVAESIASLPDHLQDDIANRYQSGERVTAGMVRETRTARRQAQVTDMFEAIGSLPDNLPEEPSPIVVMPGPFHVQAVGKQDDERIPVLMDALAAIKAAVDENIPPSKKIKAIEAVLAELAGGE